VSRPPTLLVPGWSDTPRALARAERFLRERGWSAADVGVVAFRDRYGSNLEHAEEIGAAVARLQASSGALRVAVVAHSMGGLALRRYLAADGGRTVGTAIFVGTPHHGTWVAWLAWGRGGVEMRPGSSFLRDLENQPLPRDVRAACIRTPVDTRVVPGSSAFLAGASCHTVKLPLHSRMMRHRGTLELVQRLLLERAA
jgi:triacylglycerol lipase